MQAEWKLSNPAATLPPLSSESEAGCVAIGSLPLRSVSEHRPGRLGQIPFASGHANGICSIALT
jgi:hypothetical protein